MREIRPDYRQQFLLPPSVEDWVPPDHEVRFVRSLVESLDLKVLGFEQHPAGPGAPYYASETLLSVWLYGYMLKIRSTRQLEKACANQMPFIWLTGNRCPDHNTLWRFFDRNMKAIGQLFKQTARLAVSVGMVDFVLQAVDGTRIPAAVSTSHALHQEELEALLCGWDVSVDEGVKAIEAHHKHDKPAVVIPKRLQDAKTLQGLLRKALAQLNPAPSPADQPGLAPPDPRPKDTRAQLEQVIEQMREQGLQHLHPHDAQARVVNCPDRNRRLLGYNAQVMVDQKHQVIVGQTVVQTASDKQQLEPMLEQTQQTVGRVAGETLADSGYACAEQLHKAHPHPVLVNLTQTTLPRVEKPFHKSKFSYQSDLDVCICPVTGAHLPYEGTSYHQEKKQRYRRYRCQETQCPHRHRCTRTDKGRIIEIGEFQQAMDDQILKQKDPQNKKLLRHRGQIVEPVFGRIKQNFGFRRFTVYGLDAVQAQWSLVCSAYNIRTILINECKRGGKAQKRSSAPLNLDRTAPVNTWKASILEFSPN